MRVLRILLVLSVLVLIPFLFWGGKFMGRFEGEAAGKCSVSIHTLPTQVTRVRAQLGARSQAELRRHAIMAEAERTPSSRAADAAPPA
jgi:hypothetical protein